MGHRLSKIYTRTGDKGTTGLGDGTRVSKDSQRVEAYGDVDELNSTIGLLLSHDLPHTIHEKLTGIQHHLFDLGGELSIPSHTVITDEHVSDLEIFLDTLNSELQPLKEFILPGGTHAASVCHIARCVCRRAERKTVTLQKTETVNAASVAYLNRLSDLLFVIARFINKDAQTPDILWNHDRNKK
ncbi:MAG: cob(I)yrinic acid a,c-diamide adenosyltransferase [Gammaproteobacteria bacterium]|nr:cob(I)yrinic acid a,c-diamide adenosyltransferase [Gammaproteobacteria bacterium]